MKKIKVRRIGNSLGILLPKDSGVVEGDELLYSKSNNVIKLDSIAAAQAHDRKLIEDSFADFERGEYYTLDEIAKEFAQHGWPKPE